MIFKPYPYWVAETLEEVKKQLREICNLRKDDITQAGNLNNTFIGGRSVGKIPANSADVAATDRINDISRDNTSTYVLQNTASPQWIKYTGSTF